MSFKPVNLKVNYTDAPYASDRTRSPIFSWGIQGSLGTHQAKHRITVLFQGELLWDSGFVETSDQTAIYQGSPLPCGARIDWNVEIVDNNGFQSEKGSSYFKTVFYDEWNGKWICSPRETAHEAQYFKKTFSLSQLPVRAVLYHCGLGFDKAYINQISTNEYRLTPAFTNYKKECRYVTDIIDISSFIIGENSLDITVCSGWRKNFGKHLENLSEERPIEFMGDMCLNAQLVMYFSDGSTQSVYTDDTWEVSTGHITYSHLFNGETYDENAKIHSTLAIYTDFAPDKLVAETTEPICVKRTLSPTVTYQIGNKTIYDFGENIAGVVQIKAEGIAGDNSTFVLRHAELTDSKGELFTAPLRSALATDRYICHAGMHNIEYAPEFVYHGFRYAELSIDGDFTGDISVVALQFYNDIDSNSLFRCGNSTVNDIYRIALNTEHCNLHSIASDCPQRDERLAWMNDATIRFMTMPYLFNTANLFEKIASDIANEQDDLGRITCTAPFVFGERPADPVCSAYLIATVQHYRFTGSSELIKAHYDSFIKWSEYLKTREEDGIVDYSYYGDWAGPETACTTVTSIGNTDTEVLEGYEPGAAHSRYVPGTMISTGCHYMNFRLLARFAEILGKPDDVVRFNNEADRIQTAFLNKWCTNGKVHNGSQGCQAFALFIDILPEAVRQEAADIMADTVRSAGCIQTGNIVTAMLYDMLCKYGYVDLAWELFSRTEYPSIGYMLANGATTIWERYELKEDCGMNSHNHPMHGAAIGFLYRSLAGFTINKPNKSYALKPLLPEKLSFYELKIPLLYGEIYLKYEEKYGKQTVIVDVPFGLELELSLGNEVFGVSRGHHHAEKIDEIWSLTNY